MSDQASAQLLADPEFLRRWQAYQPVVQASKTGVVPPNAQALAQDLASYVSAKGMILGQDEQGNPAVRESEKSVWKDIGKTLLGMGIAAGGYFAAPVIAGALGGGGGAAAGGSYVADAVAGTAAKATAGNPGFWSGLVGAVTGGSKAGLIGRAADTMLGMSGAMTENREGQMGRDIQRDALRLRENENFNNNQVSRADLLMRQQAAERQAQQDAFRKSVLGAVAARTQDAVFDRSKFNNVSNITLKGGLRPSDLGTERLAGTALEAAALKALTNPEKRPEMAPIERTPITEEKKGSFWENLLGAGGMLLGQPKPAPVSTVRR